MNFYGPTGRIGRIGTSVETFINLGGGTGVTTGSVPTPTHLAMLCSHCHVDLENSFSENLTAN